MMPDDVDDHDVDHHDDEAARDVDHHHGSDNGVQVCGGLAGAAVRAEGLGSSNQLQSSKSETFAMLGAVNIYMVLLMIITPFE